MIVSNVRGKSGVANKSARIDSDDLSELRLGLLKAVYHGAPSVLTLKELVCNYDSLVEDATRVMLRIKALFRARAIATPGTACMHFYNYHRAHSSLAYDPPISRMDRNDVLKRNS